MGRVEGKVAIVTGAAKGLGEADARLVLSLASDESRFVNGQRFIIDNSASATQGAVPA